MIPLSASSDAPAAHALHFRGGCSALRAGRGSRCAHTDSRRRSVRSRPRLARGARHDAVPVPGRGMGGVRGRSLRSRPRADRHGQDARRGRAAAGARRRRRTGPAAAAAPPVAHSAPRARGGHGLGPRRGRRGAAPALDGGRAHGRHGRGRAGAAGEAPADGARDHAREPHAAARARRLAGALRGARCRRR